MEQTPNNEPSFTYHYSAAQQEEVQRIRNKYAPKAPSKLEELQALDREVEHAGRMLSIVVGTIGALVLGFGMTCTTVWADTLFFPGIFVGLFGLAGIIAAYPLHRLMQKRKREKLTPKILQLTEELLN